MTSEVIPATESVTGRRTFARRASLTNDQIFLQYFTEHDVFFCLEGILKLVSIVCCTVLAALSLAGGADSAACSAGAAGAALAVAAALALLVAARALHLPRRKPTICLLTDIVACSVGGALGLLAGALLLALCRPRATLLYLRGGLWLCVGALLLASASLTYFPAMRLRDGARAPPRRPPPRDLDV